MHCAVAGVELGAEQVQMNTKLKSIADACDRYDADYSLFGPKHIASLRKGYKNIKTVNPENLEHFHKIFAKASNEQLKQLENADINFVSKLARNARIRREQ